MKDFLRNISLFSELSDEELDFLTQVASEKEYPKGSHIIHKNDPGLSLYLLREGEVKVILEEPSGKEIHLSTLKRYEFFGEMSLFSGKSRSATVVAKEKSTIVEISREVFLNQMSKHPEISLKIVGVMAERLRRSDQIVKEYANKIFSEVYPKLENILADELDTVKAVYQKTEDRALRTVEDVDRSWRHLTRIIYIIIGVFTVLGSIIGGTLTYIGYENYTSIAQKFAEVENKYSKIKEIYSGSIEAEKKIKIVEQAAVKVNVIREIMLNIQNIKNDLLTYPDVKQLDKYELKDKAINFVIYKRDLFNNYIKKNKDYQPEIVLESIETYMELIEKGQVHLEPQEIDNLVQATLHVLKKSKNGEWRMQQKARGIFLKLADQILKERREEKYQELIAQLEVLVRDQKLEDHVRFNIAILLARLGVQDDTGIAKLKEIMIEGKNLWRRNLAAFHLILLGKEEGWKHMNKAIFSKDRESFVAAFLLSELGKEKLKKMGVEQLVAGKDIDPINLINNCIQNGLPENASVFMREYINVIGKELMHSQQ